MQLDITQQIYDLDGNPMKYPEWTKPERGKDGQVVEPQLKPEKEWKRLMTLKTVMLDGLMAQLDEDKSTSGEDKIKMYDLATRLHRAKDKVEIDPDELKMVRDRINKAYTSPFVVAPVWKMLNDLESIPAKKGK